MPANTLANIILWIKHAELLYLLKKSTPRDIWVKGKPGMTATVYILSHTLCCEPYIRAFRTLHYTLIPTYTNYTKTANAPFSHPEINPQPPLFRLYLLADVLERV